MNSLERPQSSFDYSQYQIPLAFESDERFEVFIKDLFNEINSTDTFQRRGSSGQSQNGFDVYSTELKIAVECKKKDINRTAKELKRELKSDIQKSFDKLKDYKLKHKFPRLIIVSTFRNDSEIQNKALGLSDNSITVNYWGWNELKERLQDAPNTFNKYWPDIYFSNQRIYSFRIPKKGNSKINDNRNILIQLHEASQKFFPLRSLRIYTLENLYPFNNTDKYGLSDGFTLEVKNEKVTGFFSSLTFDKEKHEINQIEDHQQKVEDIIDFLNANMFFYIRSSKTQKSFKIPLYPRQEKCNCVVCSYSDFDFSLLLDQLKENNKIYDQGDIHDKLNNAFVNFKIGDFYAAYQQLKAIIDKNSSDFITRFICYYNLKNLYYLLKDNYTGKKIESALKYIEGFDLEDILLHGYRDEEIKAQLLWIKDGGYVKNMAIRIDRWLWQIQSSYNKSQNAQSAIYELLHDILYVSYFIKLNYLCYDTFMGYEQLVLKSFNGILAAYKVQSCSGKKNWLRNNQVHIIFDDALLELMIHHIDQIDLKELFDRYEIKEIETNAPKFIPRVKNMLRSAKAMNIFLQKSVKGNNYFFTFRYDRIVGNTIFLLSKVKVSKEDVNGLPSLIISFFQESKNLAWYSISKVTHILYSEEKSSWFSNEELNRFLRVMIKKKYPSTEVISAIISATHFNYPKFRINSRSFFTEVISAISPHDLKVLVHLWKISGNEGQKLIEERLYKDLDGSHNLDLYFEAAIHRAIDYKRYFDYFLDKMVKESVGWDYEVVCDKVIPYGFSMNWFIQLLYTLNIDTNHVKLQALAKRHEYFNWLLNLETYDYSKFKLEWLLLYDVKSYREKFKHCDNLKIAIERGLRKNFNDQVAKIYYKIME